MLFFSSFVLLKCSLHDKENGHMKEINKVPSFCFFFIFFPSIKGVYNYSNFRKYQVMFRRLHLITWLKKMETGDAFDEESMEDTMD